ncbi:EthD family reductase [Paenalcaligenes sp. Me52]|uniref:EthD family reductase n=1 Tax=Paenalcaligenes sp. Me52 TaxID=3392038 RepID=UPI003D27C301
MTIRMGLLYKKPEWTTQQFQQYWLQEHGALASELTGIRHYWQNHVVEHQQRGIQFARGTWEIDGFSILDVDTENAFISGELAQALQQDEQCFLSTLHILELQRHDVIPVPDVAQRSQLMKRMSILRRRDDMSEDAFRKEWRMHAELVRKMPGVKGYRQNVVLRREKVKGQVCAYEQLPIDGVVELWFEDTASVEQAFGSEQGQETMVHAQSFLQEITVFGVKEYQVR